MLRPARQAAAPAADAGRGALRVIRTARAILRKDLLLELRTKESVPAMTLFTVTVYVLFHFGLDRDSLDGELASGVLWVTLLLAAVIGVTRLFAAEREQGGIDGLLLAPVDRTALFAGQGAPRCSCSSSRSSWWRCRRSGCCCSGPAWAAPCPSCSLILLLGNLGHRRGGRAGGRAGRRDARARADRAAAAAAAARAAADRLRPGHRAAAAPGRGGRRTWGAGWGCSASTMWCSCFSP